VLTKDATYRANPVAAGFVGVDFAAFERVISGAQLLFELLGTGIILNDASDPANSQRAPDRPVEDKIKAAISHVGRSPVDYRRVILGTKNLVSTIRSYFRGFLYCSETISLQ
jgi:hypothetical protein